MAWTKKILLTTDRVESKILSIKEEKKKKHSYELVMENGDTGSYYNMFPQMWLQKGSPVTYQIEKSELSEDDKSFLVNSFIKLSSGDELVSSVPIKILREIDKNNILFFDIETVRSQKSIKVGEPLYDSWVYKNRNIPDIDYKKSFTDKAPLYPEFGKICCISVGYIDKSNKLNIKSFYGEDERKILLEFTDILAIFSKNKKLNICGFSIKQFDIPYLTKRLMVNGMFTPEILDFSQSKPWELDHIIDLKDIWKGASWDTASLINLTTVFGLPSPKWVMDGSEVSNYFYSGKVDEIAAYCEEDVFATTNLFLKMSLQDTIDSFQSKT